MKAKGSEILAFWADSDNWRKAAGIDGFTLNGCKGGNEYFLNGKQVLALWDYEDYDLADFGMINENKNGVGLDFEEVFLNWKANVPSDFRKNAKLIRQIEAVKEKLRFVGMGRQSLLALQFEMRVVSEMLEKIIKELSEDE